MPLLVRTKTPTPEKPTPAPLMPPINIIRNDDDNEGETA